MTLKDIQVILWKRVDTTAGKALLSIKPVNEKGETTGSGNTFIEIKSSVALQEIVRPGVPFSVNEKVEVEVKSSDGSSVKMEFQYNERGQEQRRAWRLLRQNSNVNRPAEWAPGFRLPNSLDKIEGHYLLLIRDTAGKLHARTVPPSEMKTLPVDLAERMRADDVGIWRPSR